MEDSGYYSHKSGEFKLFSSASSSNSYRRRLFSQELLKLDYEQLKNSDKFKHLVSGFRDENDFEEFKTDLRDFWKLKQDTCEEFGEQHHDEPSTEHMLMEFFNSDENFKEFERVFDDFKHHRFYDFDELKKRRSRGDPHLSEDSNVRWGAGKDDAFSDFFNNDEDFQEFEEEFANFKVMQRRSRALDDFNRRSWCDLRSDVNASCDRRKGKTDNPKQSSVNDEGVSNRCQGDHHHGDYAKSYQSQPGSEKVRVPKEEPECARPYKRQSTNDESQYYTCREFPENNLGNPPKEPTSPYNMGPGGTPVPDPPSYDFVMQNRKYKPNIKSHSCDYDDRNEPNNLDGRDWNPKTHSRSQSYDFSQNSQAETSGKDFRSSSNQKNQSSSADFSNLSDHSYSSSNRKSSTSSRTHSEDKFDKTDEQYNKQKQKSSFSDRSQSYDFSKQSEEMSDIKKYNLKSHSFDSKSDTSYESNDKKSSAFSRSQSRDYSEKKKEELRKEDYKSKTHSSNSMKDSKYEYSAHDQNSSGISRSQSYDFSENISNGCSDSVRKSTTKQKSQENSKYEYNGCDKKSSAQTAARSQSQDYSEKVSERVSNDSRSSKVNRSSISNVSESSKYDFNGAKKQANTTSRSQSYDFAENSQQAYNDRKKSNVNVGRHSFDAAGSRESKVYTEGNKETGKCDLGSFDDGKSRYSDSFCDYSHLGKKFSPRNYRKSLDCEKSPSISEADFYDCSGDEGVSQEELYREIYHGSTDFSKRNGRYFCDKYGVPKVMSHLPTVYSRHSSDSEIHMGGTYPNIRLDNIPVSEGLKRRSAEYYKGVNEDDLGEYYYSPCAKIGKDYGQRRSRSDYSVYKPRTPQKHACAKCLSEKCCNSNSKDCQYTCHHRCRPLVTLDCKAASGGSDDSPQEGDDHSAETSLSEVYNCQPFQSDFDTSQSPESSQNEDTDSGYRSGGIQGKHLTESRSRHRMDPDSVKREELRKLIDRYSEQSPSSFFCFIGDSLAFQGFIRVTLNLIRPITMSLGARPPSIYEVLTKEHIVEQNTMYISFYMPRDTIKQIHVASENTTKEVITALLKKYKILDNPRKFAMYAQELDNGKIVKLWRVGDKEFPLQVCLNWGSEDLKKHRLVLQENETGEIEWNAFSQPELMNFMRILDKEEGECVAQLQYKYKVMKRIIQQRMKEIRKERKEQSQRS